MPTVLGTGPTITQNLAAFPQRWAYHTPTAVDPSPVLIRLARKDGQAELAWVACLNTKTPWTCYSAL